MNSQLELYILCLLEFSKEITRSSRHYQYLLYHIYSVIYWQLFELFKLF